MERFVMITVITVALLWGAFYFMGPKFFVYSNSDHMAAEAMRPAQAGHVAQSFTATTVDVRYAAARLQVVPEDRTDIAVEITNPGRTPMPEISQEGATLAIDGHLRGRINNCRESDSVRLEGYGDFAQADLPQIVIHTPRAVNFSAGGDVSTTVGASQSVDATLSGCGDTQIGDTAGLLRVKVRGVGHAHAGAAHGLEVDLEGTGGVTVGAVTDHANIVTAGTGDVSITSLTGSLQSQDSGVGSLTIDGGQIGDAHVMISGVGNAKITAPIQSLHAVIMGVGNVDVPASVGDLDAEVMGPGSVHVQAVTGNVQKHVMGPGSVTIGS